MEWMNNVNNVNNSNMNEEVDTYLDAEATLTRLRSLEEQSDIVKSTIDETKGIMEELQKKFAGVSAANLQKEYMDVEATFFQFRQFLQQKIKDMETLTGNITATDEE